MRYQGGRRTELKQFNGCDCRHSQTIHGQTLNDDCLSVNVVDVLLQE